MPSARNEVTALTALAGAMFVTACSIAADLPYSPAEHPIAVGWVQAAGEVRIYARKEDLGKLYDGSCISGVMTGARLMPKKFTNRHVAVYGRLVDKSEFEDLVLHGVSTGVENYCNSPKIAIISRIEEVPVKAR